MCLCLCLSLCLSLCLCLSLSVSLSLSMSLSASPPPPPLPSSSSPYALCPPFSFSPSLSFSVSFSLFHPLSVCMLVRLHHPLRGLYFFLLSLPSSLFVFYLSLVSPSPGKERQAVVVECVGGGGGEVVGCLTSQQYAGVSQGQICSDHCTCCYTEIEIADQTFYLTQSWFVG